MKKVGLLISSLNNGGAERVVSRLSKILSSKFEIFVILFEDTYMSYDYSGKLISLNVQANKSFLKIIPTIKRSLLLREIKEKYSLECVISFLDSPNVVNILSKTIKCKTAISIRNYSISENKGSIISYVTNLCIKLLYNKADFIIPVSQVIAKSMVNEYGIEQSKISVIYNPYDVNEIQELANEEIEDMYKPFFNEGKIFISVGRDMYQKGYWHLVKAFKLVNDKFPESKLVLVGRDNNNGKTQQLVKELGLESKVLLIGQHNNPFKFIKASTIYVLTSLFEGFPNAMVEAMACGCPVIATDCKTGPREILYENPNLDDELTTIELADYGVLTVPFDFSEDWDYKNICEEEITLSNAMIMLCNSDELLNDYSIKSIERSNTFSYNNCRNLFERIIGLV